MRCNPVKNYPSPKYPIYADIISHPELLQKHLPPIWKKTARIASLAAFFLSLNGCEADLPNTITAPVFEHGSGTGGIGCMMIAPPVFLSEEEALQLIKDQLSANGIYASMSKVPIKGVVVSKKKYGTKRVEVSSPNPYKCDIYDPTRELSIEFVSKEEYFQLGGEKETDISWQNFKFKELAKQISTNVKENGKKGYFGIFYEPGAILSPELTKPIQRERQKQFDAARRKGMEELAKQSHEINQRYDDEIQNLTTIEKEKSKQMLREQVKDFLDWLTAQGVI